MQHCEWSTVALVGEDNNDEADDDDDKIASGGNKRMRSSRNDNTFAALHDDDSDDNEEGGRPASVGSRQSSSSIPSAQLAPASFSFLSAFEKPAAPSLIVQSTTSTTTIPVVSQPMVCRPLKATSSVWITTSTRITQLH